MNYTIDPPATQSSDPNKPCYVPPDKVPSNPLVKATSSCGIVNLSFSNSVTLQPGQISDPVDFVYTDASGSVQTVTLQANETRDVQVTFPEDSGDKSVEYGVKDGKLEKISVQTDCQPNNPPEPPKDKDAMFTAPTVIDECGVENDKVVFGTSNDGVFSFGGTLAGDDGSTVREVVFTPNDGFVVPKPGAGDSYVIRDGNAVWTFTTTNQPCTPPPTVTPEGPTFVDKCGVDKDGYTVPGTPTDARSSIDPEGNIYAVSTYTTDKGVYTVTDTTVKGQRKVVVTFEVTDPTAVITEPDKGDTYKLIEGVATWKYSYTNEACPVPPTTPEKPTVPEQPIKPAAAPKPPVKTSSLAATGADAPYGVLAVGALLLMSGVGLTTLYAVRRRRAVVEK